MSESMTTVERWAPIAGKWEIATERLRYLGEATRVDAGSDLAIPLGIALSGVPFDKGRISTSIKLASKDSVGRVLLGFDSWESRFVAVGIGGPEWSYIMSEHDPRTGWRTLATAGVAENLELDYPYPVDVMLDGQKIRLSVEGIRVLEHILSQPLDREQVGIWAAGTHPVDFGPVCIAITALTAFVVMQFGQPFDDLYEEVIRPVCEDAGIDAFRADDIYQPGVIIQDVIQGLAESNVIVAEITPTNANVFYELGYAHALNKPVILLAERGTELPFDVSGYRVIFYDNAIRGKARLETELRRHLTNIFSD